MAVLETTMFGALEYEPVQLIVLVAPLPGLPGTTRLLPVSQQVIAPFVFFQSVEDAAVCLLATPAQLVKEDFRLELSAEDRQMLGLENQGEAGTGPSAQRSWAKGLSQTRPTDISPEIGVFAFVSVAQDQSVTANLLAPLVIHLAAGIAMQAIQPLDESFLRYRMDIAVGGGPSC